MLLTRCHIKCAHTLLRPLGDIWMQSISHYLTAIKDSRHLAHTRNDFLFPPSGFRECIAMLRKLFEGSTLVLMFILFFFEKQCLCFLTLRYLENF